MGIVSLALVGSTWNTGLSAPGGLVGKDRRCEALSVRFTTNGEADASEGGGGGGGEVGGEAMILFDKLC